eukprot:CAMPEP_0198326692 /NCGR_PEP_ID=MMETSP1450-20131203/14139_1 /TAXON_ID=753684 ORGANISM="Madagascaria erythrocladiodes, Strain CCMP3234" /NCGR_SAMPLE_ID=MMETSP1450 /ASSEMBLY_ACC=CAM_ASM_001115 /LENGTH=763 /DNA_ID=CAMNT_0044030669 /DNA_START=67 /DNA_END=2358 /DNA_ORIENTATION=+
MEKQLHENGGAVDVAVVGGGLAGMTAAIEAIEHGASVHLLDKCDALGGNSAKATSGISAAVSEEDIPAFLEDATKSQRGYGQSHLVKVLVERSPSAMEWIAKHTGLQFTNIVQCGGHSGRRTHRLAPLAPVGYSIVSALKRRLHDYETSGLMKTTCSAVVTRLVNAEDGEITGLEYTVDGQKTPTTLKCGSIILATGGYAADRTGLLKKFGGPMATLPTTNGPFATGDGIKLGTAVDAQLTDMEHIQVHPTSFVNGHSPFLQTKFVAPEALRGSGAVLMTLGGQRFVNELASRDVVTRAIQTCGTPSYDIFKEDNTDDLWEYGQPFQCALLIMTAPMVEMFGKTAIDFYCKKGLITEHANLASALSYHRIRHHESQWCDTLKRYAMLSDGDTDEFDKSTFPLASSLEGVGVENLPIWTAVVTPAIHYSMGGLAVDGAAQVLNERGKSIPGLFACGETTGGIHGANRLAGNSLLECIVYGRVAGERAASKRHYRRRPLKMTEFVPLALRETQPLDGTDLTVCRFNLPSAWDVLDFRVGQYVAVKVGDSQDETATNAVRLYSPISRPNDRGVLELLVKSSNKNAKPGRASVWLNSLRAGSTVAVSGPLGGLPFDVLDSKVNHLVLIAGGVGISAMIQIIRAVYHQGGPKTIDLLYATTNIGQVAFRDILESKSMRSGGENSPHLRLSYFLENNSADDSYGSTHSEVSDVRWYKGWITQDHLANILPAPGSPGLRIVICGPPPMCKAVKDALVNLHFPSDSLYSYM